MAWVVETVETCTTCGEVTAHRRRQWAPLRIACWLVIGGVSTFSLALWTLGAITPLSGLLLVGFGALLGRGLWTSDAQRHWDLACARCRERALEGERRLRRAPSTFDPF